MPINYESQKETLKRRQALAEQLIQKDYLSNTPQGAVTSPYAGLAQMLSSFTGNYQRSRADRDIRKLNEQQGLDKSADMAALLQLKNNSQRLMPPVKALQEMESSYVTADPFSGVNVFGNRDENLNVPPAPAVTIPSATIPNSFNDYGNLFPRMRTEEGRRNLLQASSTNEQLKAAQRAEEVKFDRAVEMQSRGAGNLATAKTIEFGRDREKAEIETVNKEGAAARLARALVEANRKKAIVDSKAAEALAQSRMDVAYANKPPTPVGKPKGDTASVDLVNKNEIISAIDRIFGDPSSGIQEDPGLMKVVGGRIGERWETLLPGSDQADFIGRFNNLKSQAFLNGLQRMRGTGALSDAEGLKVQQAVSALSLSSSPKAFRENGAILRRNMFNLYKAMEQDRIKGQNRSPGQAVTIDETPRDPRFVRDKK